MPTTAEMLLAELETAGQELLQYGTHEGSCTNAAQMAILPKVAACKKHQDALKSREKRFKQALDNLNLLRDVFGPSGS